MFRLPSLSSQLESHTDDDASRDDMQSMLDHEGDLEDNEGGLLNKSEPVVLISCRGRQFKVPLLLLTKHPSTRLARDTAVARQSDSETGEIRLEYFQNSTVLEVVLDFYHNGQLHFPEAVCWDTFEAEMRYWRLKPDQLAACCKKRYLAAGAVQRTTLSLQKDWELHMGRSLQDLADGKAIRSISLKMWHFFEDANSSIYARAWSLFSTVFLAFSLCILIVQSLPAVRESNQASGNSSMNRTSTQTVSTYEAFMYMDIFVCLVLLLEYLMRFICCPQKFVFVKSPKMIMVVLSLLPSATGGLMFYFHSAGVATHSMTYMDAISVLFRIRILRVFALLRYEQYYPTLSVFIKTVSASWRAVVTMALLLLAMTVFYGGCLYYLEIGRIKSIPYGMWWAAVTMTTLGYGDVYPTSLAGYLLGVFCVVSGIIALVLPIPVVSMHYEHYTAAMTKFQNLKDRLQRGDKTNMLAVDCCNRNHAVSAMK